MSAAVQAPARPAVYPRPQMDPPQLLAALSYAARGWPVFPCKPRDKRPLITDWPNQASTDPATIRAWWHRYPQANVAIVPPPGLVVIDIDAKANGIAWLEGAGAALCPPTLTSETGGGGLHLLYAVPPDAPIRQSAGEIAPGVDVRAAGKGYIVAPPSLHPAGGLYHWRAGAGPDNTEPTAAPWPLLLLLTTAPAPAPVAVPETPRPTPAASAPWSTEQLLTEARAKTSANNRNHTGFWLACQLRDEGYSESEAESVMHQYQQGVTAGADPYTWKEARASVRSAYRRAPRDPRIGRRQRTPPLAPVDSNGVIADVDPGAVDWSDLYREIDALYSENAALRAELDALAAPVDERIAQLTQERDALQAWKDGALTVLFGNPQLDTGDRVGLIALQQLIEEQDLPVADAPTGAPAVRVPVEQQAAAARCNVSKSTMSRWFDRWDTMGLTDHLAGPDPEHPILDRKGRQRFAPDGRPMYANRTHLACKARPFEVVAALTSPTGEKGMRRGGKRECPACHIDGAESETFEARRCRGCGAVYMSDGTILVKGTDASQFPDATGAENTSCTAEPDHDLSALGAMADLPLRTVAEELRQQASHNPRIAAKLHDTRARLHRADQDAHAGEYAHEQATRLHNETVRPPVYEPPTDPGAATVGTPPLRAARLEAC